MSDLPINKRYIVFAGDCYYPGGGMGDFILDTDDLDEAKKAITGHDWGHILDTETRETIYAR